MESSHVEISRNRFQIEGKTSSNSRMNLTCLKISERNVVDTIVRAELGLCGIIGFLNADRGPDQPGKDSMVCQCKENNFMSATVIIQDTMKVIKAKPALQSKSN